MRGIDILIGDILVDRFCDGLAGNQRFNFLLDRKIRPFDQRTHDAVGTGVGPVWSGQSFFILGTKLNIIDDTPWIIDFGEAELVAVIPLPEKIPLLFKRIE